MPFNLSSQNFDPLTFLRERLRHVEALLKEGESSATSTRTRELLAQKEKELDAMKNIPPTSTR